MDHERRPLSDGRRGSEAAAAASEPSGNARRGSDAAGGASAHPAGGTRPESGKANLSLGLGAAGLVLGFLLLFAVLTPAAIVAAVGALRDIRLQPSLRGRWKAWTGIGLAIVAPVLWVSAFLAFAESGTFGLF
jgi:hypothetical protein